MSDWSSYGAREVRVEEIQKLCRLPKHWGWVDGMYLAGNDDKIALRFLHAHRYEPVTRELWRRLCNKAACVVDVGAHTGVFSLDAFRAGAKQVLSIEPHPVNFSRLVMNLRYNNFPCTGCFFGAAGEDNKISNLLVKEMYLPHAAGRMELHNKNGLEFPVNVSRLDQLLPEALCPLIKVIKIDAENFTGKVLSGMGKILEHHPDLIIECTMEGLDVLLKPLGYRFWAIWETGRIDEVEGLHPFDPQKEYNGTHQDCRNRFASIRDLPDAVL